MARGDAMAGFPLRIKKSLTIGHRVWRRKAATVWESVHPYQSADDSAMITKLIKQASGWVYREEGVDSLAGKSLFEAFAQVASWDVQTLGGFLTNGDADETRLAEVMLKVER